MVWRLNRLHWRKVSEGREEDEDEDYDYVLIAYIGERYLKELSLQKRERNSCLNRLHWRKVSEGKDRARANFALEGLNRLHWRKVSEGSGDSRNEYFRVLIAYIGERYLKGGDPVHPELRISLNRLHWRKVSEGTGLIGLRAAVRVLIAYIGERYLKGKPANNRRMAVVLIAYIGERYLKVTHRSEEHPETSLNRLHWRKVSEGERSSGTGGV